MKKLILLCCFALLASLVKANDTVNASNIVYQSTTNKENMRITGTFSTKCGTWSFVIHADDFLDAAVRLLRLQQKAIEACDTGATAVTSSDKEPADNTDTPADV